VASESIARGGPITAAQPKCRRETLIRLRFRSHHTEQNGIHASIISVVETPNNPHLPAELAARGKTLARGR